MTRLARFAARHHPIVWWVVALKLAFALAFTVVAPPYRGPDESKHVDRVRATTYGYTDPAEARLKAQAVERTERLVSPDGSQMLPPPPVREEDATARGDRPTFAELAGFRSRFWNTQFQHPPLYYDVVSGTSGVVMGFLPADVWTWDREVYLYRLFSVLLGAALPLLASAAALALGLSRLQAAVAAAFLLLLPGATFLGAVVNNDALLVPLTALATTAVLRYLRGGGAAWAYVAAAAAGGGALTKSTAALLVPWVGIAVAWEALRRRRRGDRTTVVRTLAVTGVLLVAGLSWHLANAIRYGDPQPSPDRDYLRLGLETSFLDFVPTWATQVTTSFWGRPLSRFDNVTLAWPITHLLTALLAVAVLAALWRAPRALRRPLWLMAGVGAVQLAVLGGSNLRAYYRYTYVTAAQGRYLYPLLVPAALLVAVACGRLVHRVGWLSTRVVAVALAAIGVALHLELARSMIAGWWAGAGAGDKIAALLAWSPLPVPVTLAVLVSPLVVTAAGALGAYRASRAVTTAVTPALGTTGARATPPR